MSSACAAEPSLASPNKRLKSQVVDESLDPESFKGNQPLSCGICYADCAIAGEIDSCNHYFCFECIMEWAKHETRCPICRQRFSNIRRPAMHGVFSFSRDIKVPVRDQVYHPYGNMTRGPVDHSAEVKCSNCHGGADDHLLLLCDLCDTAWHTYCVGLGYTVPEGDWFCNDCAVSRATNANKDSDQENAVPTSDPRLTVFDIVRESSSQVVRRPRASSLQQKQSSSAIPLPGRVSKFKGRNPESGGQHVQRNVQAFRENWNALRSGSLRFHCNSFESGGIGSQKQDSSSLSCGKSDESHYVASTGLHQSTVQGGPSSDTLNERGSKDVDKAWKMMERAKMMQRTRQRTSSIPPGLDHPSCSGGARKISSAHCKYQEIRNQQSRTLDLRYNRMENQCDYSSLNNNLVNRWSLKLGERKRTRVTHEEMMEHVRGDATHSEGYCEPPLCRKVPNSIQSFPCYVDGERNVAEEQSWSACLITSVGSAPSRGNSGSMFSSRREVGNSGEKKRLAKSFGNENTRKCEDAKTEIKSLVKLNLKVLTRDNQLGVETFKLVARQATHTILAACRSEQQNSNIYSSSSVCSHNDHSLQFQKSTLMPRCCRQCFYVFVNDVVNSTLLQKLAC